MLTVSVLMVNIGPTPTAPRGVAPWPDGDTTITTVV